mmetsp:Transcript_16014/g.44281  ORF Transcript_16014/g.44281 Transcript_16014/m.44281 type:complete len:80 (+) Transcript_16014:351-590(+)
MCSDREDFALGTPLVFCQLGRKRAPHDLHGWSQPPPATVTSVCYDPRRNPELKATTPLPQLITANEINPVIQFRRIPEK